jgi:putative IMPACT (imprinted ancient) family translation regulator
VCSRLRIALLPTEASYASADPASHEMFAWRAISTKPGKDGAASVDDWQVKSGWDDDGEKGGAGKVMQVLEREGALDVAVVCSRWYGGTMLGPMFVPSPQAA